MNRRITMLAGCFLVLSMIAVILLAGCGSSNAAVPNQASSQFPTAPLGNRTSSPTSAPNPATEATNGTVKVVVAGYMNHGPLGPTVQAIKDVLAKYGSKVDVTWVDLGTNEGVAYFKANNITAHMNIIINGKVTYNVNGKDVTFQWFEGQQWTRQDLDTVIAGLVSK